MPRKQRPRPVADLFGVQDAPLWSGTPKTVIDQPFTLAARAEPTHDQAALLPPTPTPERPGLSDRRRPC